jgi:hypothetical protein
MNMSAVRAARRSQPQMLLFSRFRALLEQSTNLLFVDGKSIEEVQPIYNRANLIADYLAHRGWTNDDLQEGRLELGFQDRVKNAIE